MNFTTLTKIWTSEPVDLFIDAFHAFDRILDSVVSTPATLQPVLDTLNQYKSPHAQSLPLMNPFHAVAIILTYLLVIHGGKRVMAQFQRVNVSTLAFWHNIFLTWLSAYMGWGILREAVRNRYSVFTTAVDDSANGWPMAKMLWLFYVSKIFEFVDTLIMVLKKNNHQISFLHLYHHSSILLVTGVSIFYSPGGEVYLSSMLNCFVHVVMYGYYLLSSMNVKQVVFIKKYITMIQLTQFCINLVQATFIAYIFPAYAFLRGVELSSISRFPAVIGFMNWWYMISMIVLFSAFYRQDRTKDKARLDALKKEGTKKDMKKEL
ncbi:delta6 fatty acid elongase [Chytriomyces sp. MP71]|nr:delta6 fatty acid elongase [Chytriomyces sp. MP71]